MNVNLNAYVNQATLNSAPLGNGDSLVDDISEHQEIIRQVGKLTGRVAIVSDPDPTMAGTGAAQVWNETDEGPWVWINTEGEAVFAECPFE